ncbi:uncharacterized protein LOC111634923 [Centruroides sculpturatus]|uniref:uncharacterized protein LOC111634923 n=1 Tax=Centruroides sculpturatus TaxID=218467 RepID=UPI000C6DDA12|nr:uncharacterized protein LOC111634923 [Centruroides sculpturatus]
MIYHIARNTWGISQKHFKLIYKGAIEPALLYAAQIWGESANLVHLKRKLLSVQRTFAIRSCRAYRTAPTDALLAIANITPIHIKINSVIRTYNLMKVNKDHQTKGSEFAPTDSDSQAEEDHKITQLIKRHGIDNYINNTVDQHHPAERNNIHISREDGSLGPNYNWIIYTDGACNEKGTGAAVVIYNGDNTVAHEKYYKLASFCNSNQAELWAMERALFLLVKNIKNLKGSINICTDSRNAIRCINGKKKNTSLGVNIQHLARHISKKRKLIFSWIPGHSGSQGNSRADKLAANNNQLSISFDKIPINHIHKYIKDNTIKEWQREWTQSSTGRTTYQFIPSITNRQTMSYLTPTYSMTQLLTGHGNLPSYLHKIKKKSSDNCSCDDMTKCDIEHILLYCPLHNAAREELINLCTQDSKTWPLPWDYFLSTKKTYKQLENFVSQCGLFS